MKTAVLNIKIEPKIKQDAQKVARDLGLSLSAIISASLKELARNKAVSYSLLQPNDSLKHIIREAQKDRVQGNTIGPFKNVDDLMKSLQS